MDQNGNARVRCVWGIPQLHEPSSDLDPSDSQSGPPLWCCCQARGAREDEIPSRGWGFACLRSGVVLTPLLLLRRRQETKERFLKLKAQADTRSNAGVQTLQSWRPWGRNPSAILPCPDPFPPACEVTHSSYVATEVHDLPAEAYPVWPFLSNLRIMPIQSASPRTPLGVAYVCAALCRDFPRSERRIAVCGRPPYGTPAGRTCRVDIPSLVRALPSQCMCCLPCHSTAQAPAWGSGRTQAAHHAQLPHPQSLVL